MLGLVALLTVSACTLSTVQDAREITLNATQTTLPGSLVSDGSGSVLQATPSGLPPTPILQSNQTATNCGKLRVNVGTDPKATLRLREQPNNTSTVVLLIPNNSLVTQVASSQDVSAGGYTWVNIQYSDPNGVIATGWAAKDAMKNTVTLRAEGC
ncbi:MAG: hypothetical protein GC204_09965 [Chloroflexi bacterium]|nr:hypothetical protein [Chloroflexota bacterium]